MYYPLLVWGVLNNPITFIGEDGSLTQETFYEKASRRGAIFIYKKDNDSSLEQLIAF